jgi:hypothetical protein
MMTIMAHRPYPNRERTLRQIDRHYEPGQRADTPGRSPAWVLSAAR